MPHHTQTASPSINIPTRQDICQWTHADMSPSPRAHVYFTSGFTPGVTYPVGLENCPDRDPPWLQGHTEKFHCPKSSVLHPAISHLPTPDLVTVSRALPFPECHTVTLCDLFRLTFFTYWYAYKFPTFFFYGLMAHFFFFFLFFCWKNIPLSGWAMFYLFTLKDILVASKFWQLGTQLPWTSL